MLINQRSFNTDCNWIWILIPFLLLHLDLKSIYFFSLSKNLNKMLAQKPFINNLSLSAILYVLTWWKQNRILLKRAIFISLEGIVVNVLTSSRKKITIFTYYFKFKIWSAFHEMLISRLLLKLNLELIANYLDSKWFLSHYSHY